MIMMQNCASLIIDDFANPKFTNKDWELVKHLHPNARIDPRIQRAANSIVGEQQRDLLHCSHRTKRGRFHVTNACQ